MKKAILPIIMAAMAILYLPCCMACTEEQKPEPEPQKEDPVTAVITASDVTVEEGKTVSIGAATNSSAAISYTSADPSIATVSSAGAVTGVKAGNTTIALKVEAVEDKFTAAEATVKVTVTALPEPPDNNPKPGKYTFTVSPLKEQWKAGDQIYIQGGYGPAAQVLTLTADQISADGKTATADLEGDIFKYFADPDFLYAAWPADAVKKEDGLTSKVVSFTDWNTLLTQAYLEETNFKFIDVSSFLTFTVSGGYDRCIITGAMRPGLRYTGVYKNECSSVKKQIAKPKDDGYPFREEPLTDGLNTLYFPGGMKFTGGFTLYFAKDDDWSAAYTYSEDINLKAGTKLELGDITAQLTPYEGGKPHMPEVVGTTKYALKFNELSGICVDLSGSEICQISLDGELLHSAGLRTTTGSTLDSEGLSINYDTGDMLISCEPNSVCRIPAESVDNIFEGSTFKGVESLFKIDDAKNFGNSGAEGCTYYKDNLMYVGTQTGSYLYLIDLSTGEVLWRKGLREMHTVITEIAGLCYDPLTDWLWVIDSEAHKFFVLTGDAETLLGAYTLKTSSNEESICVDHKHNCVWVGDDYGSTSYVYKYEMTGLEDFIK